MKLQECCKEIETQRQEFTNRSAPTRSELFRNVSDSVSAESSGFPSGYFEHSCDLGQCNPRRAIIDRQVLDDFSDR